MKRITIFTGITRLSNLDLVYINISNMYSALIDLEPDYKELTIDTEYLGDKSIRISCHFIVEDNVIDDAFLQGDKIFIQSFLRNLKKWIKPLEFIMKVTEWSQI